MRKESYYGEETEYEPPQISENPTKQDELIWTKEYDLYLKKTNELTNWKGKVFTTIYAHCDEPMKNRLDGMSEYRTLDKNRDVVGVLKLIKELAYRANEKKYPARQSVSLMKKLFKMRQEETETLTEYYKRFISLIESVENTYGKLVPFATVTKNEKFGPNNEVNAELSETERERFLAYLFMEGVQKIYKVIMNDIKECW